MISWFMRRRCLWCSRSCIGMCWSHHLEVNRLINRAGRIALAVAVPLAVAVGVIARAVHR